MFTDLRIKNFRLFDDLKIVGLRRINLFVGKNNTGKTAVLEAMAMVAGGHSPDVPVRLNLGRGAEMPESEHGFRTYLQFFFKDLDSKTQMEIESTHRDNGVRRVVVGVRRSPVGTVVADQPGMDVVAEGTNQEILTLSLNDGLGGHSESRVFLAEGKARLMEDRTSKPAVPVLVEYVSANVDLSFADVQRISELRRQKHVEGLLVALSRIEPRIVGAPEVIADYSGYNVFCDVGLEQLMPLGLMGQGVARILRLLVRMERVARGTADEGRIFIVDEIENGFHHEAQAHVWRALDAVSNRNATQIFATTHSRECLRAAYEVIDAGDLAIHRMEADDDGAARCITLSPDAIKGTMQHGFEVR